MNKRSRAYKIYEAGCEASEHCLGPMEVSMLKVIATMIDYATKKPAKKAKKETLYNEQAVLAVLPFQLEVTRYGSLQRALGSMHLLEPDLEQFRVWFAESMYPWLESKEIEFTYSMLTRKYPEWLEKARQYKGNKAAIASTKEWR